MKDISQEIDNVFITADGKKFLSLEKAKRHQRKLKKKLSKLHI
tara:strand:- start:61 stop:189 length:129 start_codon:yes stop_codon:yes gene_type:complete